MPPKSIDENIPGHEMITIRKKVKVVLCLNFIKYLGIESISCPSNGFNCKLLQLENNLF